jgi:hypothetical protein
MTDNSQLSTAKDGPGPQPKATRTRRGSAELLAHAELVGAERSSVERRHGLSPRPLDPDALAPFLKPVLAPLQAMLEREIADRRTLQRQADDLRTQLAAAQLAAAEARRQADVEHALRLSAEARIKDLHTTVEALRDTLVEPPPYPWWWPFRRGV